MFKRQPRKLIGVDKVALVILCFIMLVTACHPDYTPKPRGYFRIEFPEKKYVHFSNPGCPFSFDIPDYGIVIPDSGRFAEPCWMNLVFEVFNGEINMSYKPLNNNLNKFTEDSRTLVYKHTVRAEAIDERLISDPANNVYGLLYEIGGNAASSVQFYVTDSTSHFLRGALYFNVPPQSDSLAPVIEFIKEDVKHMIQSIRWK